MAKRKLGNKQNAFLNGEWGKHVKSYYKRYTSSARRMLDKKIIRKELFLIE